MGVTSLGINLAKAAVKGEMTLKERKGRKGDTEVFFFFFNITFSERPAQTTL